MFEGSNIKLLTLAEQIAGHIKQSILSGKIKPGEKLPSETQLAELYEVSRPTLRNALNLLSSNNLIVSKTGVKGGHYVSTISGDSVSGNFADYLTLSLASKGIMLEQILEMRKMIETIACQLAAKRRNEKDLQRMKGILEKIENRNMLSESDYYKYDFEFHQSIALATHNELIIITINAIYIALKPLFHQLSCPEDLQKELSSHLWDIFKEIEEQNEEEAVKQMNHHLGHFRGHFSHKLFETIK